MEVKTEGIVISGTDYGENDKILTLLTPSMGKITVGIKGVRKPKAKLAFASQPFCFAEYVLAERGGRFTVTGAYLYDGFYTVRTDIVKFYAACTVIEIANALTVDNTDCKNTFIALANALKFISNTETSDAENVVAFALTALSEAGYMIDLDGCGNCGKDIVGDVYFDFDEGYFTCKDCGVGVRASESTYNYMRNAVGLKNKPMDGGEKRALRLIKAYLENKTECEFTCFSEYIRLNG